MAEDDVPLFLHFECDDLGEGPVGHIVRNDDLSGALRARLETLGVPPAASAVEAFEEQPGWVRTQLSDGSVIDSRILIGADGRASPVRDLAGIGTHTHAYRQTAMVCTIRHTEPHHDTAVERFFPAGPFAVLPMRGRRSAIVWTEPHRIAARLMQLPATDFQVELAARFDGMFGTPDRGRGRRRHFPLSLVLARRHVQGRVVLVGDAAHALHPIAGQGFNLGLRGVALLAEAGRRSRAAGARTGRSARARRIRRLPAHRHGHPRGCHPVASTACSRMGCPGSAWCVRSVWEWSTRFPGQTGAHAPGHGHRCRHGGAAAAVDPGRANLIWSRPDWISRTRQFLYQRKPGRSAPRRLTGPGEPAGRGDRRYADTVAEGPRRQGPAAGARKA